MMEKLVSVIFLLVLMNSGVHSYELNILEPLCKKLPYPAPCNYFLSQESYDPIKLSTNFLLVSLELALRKAEDALSVAYNVGSKIRNKRERTAWNDCIQLYENAIDQLNATISRKSSKVDKQTWISTALTNLHTCRTGFRELGVADFIYPLMANNVSYLLSNTLSLNKVHFRRPRLTHKFPEWVTPGERRLLQSKSSPISANAVVAGDGSGQFRTISQAVSAAAKRSGKSRFIIYVKAGVYKENVIVPKGAQNIMLIGDGIGKTIITGSKSVGGGSTTFNSATLGVVGNGFMARGITVRNTAGPQRHQAVALRSGSDLSVFYMCSFEGYQDTLYVLSQRQFYKNCNIYGTVDFIFGNAAVVLQSCNIFARYPPNSINTITAQGRTDPNQNTGISIHQCRITAAPDLRPHLGNVRTYLGRPWKAYSRTVYMNSFLDGLISPAGWYPWSGNFALNSLFYGEYGNTGPGSSTNKRVKWKGYRVISSPAVASQFTVQNFIGGNAWLPRTGVPFVAGLV